MNNQQFTLLISLCSSIAVVLISSATSIWSKRIDAKQKKQDHAFEFNKIYVSRKIDAGEDIISNNTLIIAHTRAVEELFTAYVRDYGQYYKEGKSSIDNQIDEGNELIKSKKPTYRLYFDIDETREAIAKIASKLNILSNSIKLNLEAKKLLATEVDENTIVIEVAKQPEWDRVQFELERLLNIYSETNRLLVSLLKENCNYLRNQLRKYDIEHT